METVVLPDTSRGIDMNRPVTQLTVRRLMDANVHFIMRYLSRATYKNPLDCTLKEANLIRNNGIALGFVQHVRSTKTRWTPERGEGTANGKAAREQLQTMRAPQGMTIAIDLESTRGTVDEIARYVNEWNIELRAIGMQPGIYLGDSNGLTSEQAYYRLTTERYWSAFNLNLDQYPFRRGVCMIQHLATWFPINGFHIYDSDVVTVDHLGGRWTFWGPTE